VKTRVASAHGVGQGNETEKRERNWRKMESRSAYTETLRDRCWPKLNNAAVEGRCGMQQCERFSARRETQAARLTLLLAACNFARISLLHLRTRSLLNVSTPNIFSLLMLHAAERVSRLPTRLWTPDVVDKIHSSA
jgi:hypothetical protein